MIEINKCGRLTKVKVYDKNLRDFLVNAGFECVESYEGGWNFYWANCENDLVILYMEKLIKLYLTGREPN